MGSVDLLLHPIRLRIVQAVHDGHSFTTAQLAELLPDVAQTTLYRHVGALARGGLLEIESEEKIRGTVERRYRLVRGRAVIDSETAAAMTAEDHRRGMAAAVAAVLAEFDNYLDGPDIDPHADRVSYPQFALWLSDAEKAGLIAEVTASIRARADNEPSPGRRRHLLTIALFPSGDRHGKPPARASDPAAEPDTP